MAIFGSASRTAPRGMTRIGAWRGPDRSLNRRRRYRPKFDRGVAEFSWDCRRNGGRWPLRLAVETSCFSLVICDQGLPGMDGIAVLNAIKRRHPDLPVVIVSGWSLAEIREGVRCDHFLQKPVAADELIDVLQRHLGTPSPSRRLGQGNSSRID